MKAEVFAVGTEILLGEIVDSNSAYLAGRFPSLGIKLYRITQLGDNLERLTAHLRQALADNDLVVTTGGLGPTEDDVTREAIAAAVGEMPAVDPDLAQRLRDWFGRRNIVMPERNLKQAWLIPSAQSLPNDRGTAPGWWVEKGGKRLVCLPGPPAEMRPMWEMQVESRLAALASDVIVTRTLKTVGIGEGRVDEMISEFLHAENPTVGVYSRGDGIHVRLGARAGTRAEAAALIEPVEARMREILGTALWGADEDTLQEAVVRVLRQRKMTVAVVEDAATGGSVAAQLTQVPAELRAGVWRGGEVWTRVEPADDDAALARSHAARVRWGADVGVGVAVDEARGGLHVAVSDRQGQDVTSFVFLQALPALRTRVATSAMALLRRRYCL